MRHQLDCCKSTHAKVGAHASVTTLRMGILFDSACAPSYRSLHSDPAPLAPRPGAALCQLTLSARPSTRPLELSTEACVHGTGIRCLLLRQRNRARGAPIDPYCSATTSTSKPFRSASSLTLLHGEQLNRPYGLAEPFPSLRTGSYAPVRRTQLPIQHEERTEASRVQASLSSTCQLVIDERQFLTWVALVESFRG